MLINAICAAALVTGRVNSTVYAIIKPNYLVFLTRLNRAYLSGDHGFLNLLKLNIQIRDEMFHAIKAG